MIHQKHPGALKKAAEELQLILQNDLLGDGPWIRYNENGERVIASNEPDEKDKDRNYKSPEKIALNA
jgi:hypothetical protein